MSTPSFTFDPHRYGPAVAELLLSDPDRLPDLGAGLEVDELRPRLHALKVEDLGGGKPVVDRAMARGCLSGLWLWFDFLDESHKISQDLPSDTGSFWHGVMHRREGDFWNSKYWFRQVGRHAAFPALAASAAACHATLSSPPPAAAFLSDADRWDPNRFVDLCEAAQSTLPAAVPLCQEIQRLEWRHLFDYCHRAAFG